MAKDARPHVVIVGGGFGGLTAAQALESAPVRVTLRRPHQPPHVPAAPLPGGHGGPLAGRHRAAHPRHPRSASATSRCSWRRSTRVDPGERARAPRRRRRPRLGLPRRRVRRGDVVLRPRRLGATRRPGSSRSRTPSRSASACCSPSSSPSATTSPRGARAAPQLRRHRRRTDGGRARGRARRAVASSSSIATSAASIPSAAQGAARSRRGPRILPVVPGGPGRERGRRSCTSSGVEVRTGARVTSIEPAGVRLGRRARSPARSCSGPPASARTR